tara:strand:+ start:555 stop:2495 length:1941 start_codon:yes stop_codon:yes gene_type:complete
MKRILLFTSFCLAALVASSQDLISKIPSNASVVFAIKGKNITDLVTTSEFENSKIGKLFLKELDKETKGKVTSLETLGIDVTQNFYYFLQAEESIFTHCFLVPLKSKEGFLSLLSDRKKENLITEQGLSYFTDSYDSAVTMWNDDTLLVVYTQEGNKYDAYSYDYYNDYETETAIDVVVEPSYEVAEDLAIEAPEAVIEEAPIEAEASYEEEIIIDAVEPSNDNYYTSDYYKAQAIERENARVKRDEEREERRKASLKKTLERAKSILAGNYENGSILINSNYVKSVGNDKDEAILWVNDFGSIYDQALPLMLGGLSNPYEMFNFKSLYGGMSLTSKLNFEESKASIKTIYTMNDEMASYSREMYNGKMNSNFFKYINEDNLQGYFAINMSTEGILNAYPKMLENMFVGVEKEHLEDLIPISTRLISLLLDEEAIAKIIRGDMLFVMTGLEQKEVTYTTYEYDENYESTEVTKTKNETLPNFLFMITSEEKEIFSRLMRIGSKEGVIIEQNGMYQINIPNMPFSLYMIFKDNTLLIGNSSKDMMAIHNGSFHAKFSREHKKLIAKNSTSIYINGKQIVSQIPVDMMPQAYEQKLNYISENVEDVIFKIGKIKGNVIEGEMILNTPLGKGHKNSLAYFINMMDALVD